MISAALGLADRIVHALLDGYINAGRPGWGRLQHWQWRLCNACERPRRR